MAHNPGTKVSSHGKPLPEPAPSRQDSAASTVVSKQPATEPAADPAADPAVGNSTQSATVAASSPPESPTDKSVDAKSSTSIPNIPSTSLGLFEEADQKDPNKWKKFAWKYAGAVLLFMISYKTLHWYVDRLEADGKRRRAEVEENKKIAQELRVAEPANSVSTFAGVSSEGSSLTPAVGMDSALTMAGGADSTVDDATLGGLKGEDDSPQTPLELLEQISAKIPVASSELDELRAYRLELEGRISELTRLEVSHVELPDLREEMGSLDEEIKILESKKK